MARSTGRWMRGELVDLPDDGSISDAALIERSLADADLFGHLVERHSLAIDAYVRRRIGDATEDVVAEMFLVAFARRRTYDPARADVKAWLFGIASNVMRRHKRTEERTYRAYARHGVDPADDESAGRVEDRVTAAASAPRIAAALARMPVRFREVLLLVAWADLSYEQAAEALDIPVGTVRSRLSRARRAVRSALADHDPRAISEEHSHGR